MTLAELVKDLLLSRKNANKIVEIMDYLSPDMDEEDVLTALNGMCDFFTKLFKNQEMNCNEKEDENLDTVGRYRLWLKQRYEESLKHILDMICHNSIEVQVQSLSVYFRLLESEMVDCPDTGFHFPEKRLHNLIEKLLLANEDLKEILNSCRLFWEFDDVRYYALKCIHKIVQGKSDAERVYLILRSISECMPQDMIEDQSKTLCKSADKNHKYLVLKEQQRIFTSSWLEFLRLDLSVSLCKGVLTIIDKHIIPHFSSPCLLADFLTRCLNHGGGISLLALNGIFLLMTNHNLEYPEFYSHLYGMIHPRIFNAKYRPRFFYLLNIFLMSSHLPAYLVAAFTKKLARLTLVAPAYALQLIVPFIYNLLTRHPSIQPLINRKTQSGSSEAKILNDPYSAAEPDPSKCRAMESSLWELDALKKHYSPSVVKSLPNSFSKRAMEQDLDELLELSYADMFNSLCSKKCEDFPMNHMKPEKTFGGFEDSVRDLWDV